MSCLFRNNYFFLLILILFACKKDRPAVTANPPPITDAKDLSDIPYNPVAVELPDVFPLPVMDIPVDNPLTEAGVELGRFLFYDPITIG